MEQAKWQGGVAAALERVLAVAADRLHPSVASPAVDDAGQVSSGGVASPPSAASPADVGHASAGGLGGSGSGPGPGTGAGGGLAAGAHSLGPGAGGGMAAGCRRRPRGLVGAHSLGPGPGGGLAGLIGAIPQSDCSLSLLLVRRTSSVPMYTLRVKGEECEAAIGAGAHHSRRIAHSGQPAPSARWVGSGRILRGAYVGAHGTHPSGHAMHPSGSIRWCLRYTSLGAGRILRATQRILRAHT